VTVPNRRLKPSSSSTSAIVAAYVPALRAIRGARGALEDHVTIPTDVPFEDGRECEHPALHDGARRAQICRIEFGSHGTAAGLPRDGAGGASVVVVVENPRHDDARALSVSPRAVERWVHVRVRGLLAGEGSRGGEVVRGLQVFRGVGRGCGSPRVRGLRAVGCRSSGLPCVARRDIRELAEWA
jgi:hypothetical protein